MKTATTRCGACNVAPGPGTRPGLMVAKRNAPWSSVGMRPKPLNPRSSRFFCWSSGCAYLPCEFACQISTRPSLTPTPSPSSSRPSIATRSPLAPRAAMSRVVSQSSPMWRYGPTVWLPLAYRLMSALHRRGIAAAQHDVEAVGERPFRNGVLPVEHRDQANARFLVGGRVVHRVVLEQRVSWKIHLRDHAREGRGAKQREMDVRRGPVVVGRLDVAVAEDRAGQLGQGLRRHDERLCRASLLRRGVRRVVVLRLGTRMKAAVARQLAALGGSSLIHWRRVAWKAERGRKPRAACTVRTRALP